MTTPNRPQLPSERIEELLRNGDALSRTAAICAYLDEREEQLHPMARPFKRREQREVVIIGPSRLEEDELHPDQMPQEFMRTDPIPAAESLPSEQRRTSEEIRVKADRIAELTVQLADEKAERDALKAHVQQLEGRLSWLDEAVAQRNEARGRAASSAEVTRLQAELSELRSQANEYGRHPFPAGAELEADAEQLKQALLALGVPAKNAHAALARIEAALGLVKP